MATTISVSEATRRRLMRLKLEEDERSLDALLGKMLTAYRLAKLRNAQDVVQEWMQESGLEAQDLLDPDLLE